MVGDFVPKILDFDINIHHVDMENGNRLQIAPANGHERIASLLFEKGYNQKKNGCVTTFNTSNSCEA
jgi:hypothetical protein